MEFGKPTEISFICYHNIADIKLCNEIIHILSKFDCLTETDFKLKKIEKNELSKVEFNVDNLIRKV